MRSVRADRDAHLVRLAALDTAPLPGGRVLLAEVDDVVQAAVEADRPDLSALVLNYLAIARVEAGEVDAGLDTMGASIALARPITPA